MGKVIYHTTLSLDGFVAGPNDEIDRLFAWYFSGGTDFQFPGPGLAFKVSPASAAYLREGSQSVGAAVTGRRTFNVANAWSGAPPLGVHHFVMTHSVPQEWVRDGSPFTFVTDGVESAVRQARQAAGEMDVAISSASVMRQCLQARLLDEIHIDLAPVLLGEGIRLFEPAQTPVDLEIQRVVTGDGVTHLSYRVVQ